MATITPSWTDGVSVIAAATLAKGARLRGTLDLRSKFGARLFIGMALKGTTVPANGVDVILRPVNNNGAAIVGSGAAQGYRYTWLPSGTVASTTINTTDVSAGGFTLYVAAATNFAAGDNIAIYDASFARLEFKRVSHASTTPAPDEIYIGSPVVYAHAAGDADTVIDNAYMNDVWLEGGSLWEIILDYTDDATGSDALGVVTAQTLDSYGSV